MKNMLEAKAAEIEAINKTAEKLLLEATIRDFISDINEMQDEKEKVFEWVPAVLGALLDGTDYDVYSPDVPIFKNFDYPGLGETALNHKCAGTDDPCCGFTEILEDEVIGDELEHYAGWLDDSAARVYDREAVQERINEKIKENTCEDCQEALRAGYCSDCSKPLCRDCSNSIGWCRECAGEEEDEDEE